MTGAVERPAPATFTAVRTLDALFAPRGIAVITLLDSSSDAPAQGDQP